MMPCIKVVCGEIVIQVEYEAKADYERSTMCSAIREAVKGVLDLKDPSPQTKEGE